MSEKGVWLYAVAAEPPATDLSQLSGVSGTAVRAIGAAGLTAVASDVPLDEFGESALRANLEDLAWLEAAATAHHGVIAMLANDLPVVPMRLATVYSSEANVRGMLGDRGDDLREVLRRTSGRREWGIKAYAAQERDQAGGNRAASSSGAEYLQRRRDQLSAEKDIRRAALSSAELIHSALSSLAVAAALHPPQAPQLSGTKAAMVLNAAYLLDEAGDDAFCRTVDQLAKQHPAVQLQVNGPWPPYSFAALDAEPAVPTEIGP